MTHSADSRHVIPSDICLTLAAVTNDGWLAADQVSGRLRRLGFDCKTQQVAAYLKRLSRMDAPPIEIQKSRWGDNEYRCSRYGATWLGNRLPWTRMWR